jgi:hypothetical protein
MLDDRYDVKTAPDFTSFEIDSVGHKGTVSKVVRYTEINLRSFYNLGFGDKDELTGFISDLTVTNNIDSQKVLLRLSQRCMPSQKPTPMQQSSQQVAPKHGRGLTEWV